MDLKVKTSRGIWCLLASMMGSTCMVPLALAAPYDDPFKRDLLILTDWFEGEFDNSEQVWFENFDAANIPEEDRSKRIHTTHMRLDLPQFGDHVFYVEEYIDNDPTQIIRQRFVTFESDLEANAIRMKQGFFKDTEAALGGQNLGGLTAGDVFFIDTCDVFWTREAGQFVGGMKPKACVFGEGEKRRYSVHDMTLSDNDYWRVDSTYFLKDDSFYLGNKPNRPSKMRKADRFTCDITFRPEDMSLSFQEFREQTQEVKGLSIHSEGGEFSVVRDSDGQSFTYLMREKEYPFYDERPDFIYFSVKADGANRSSVYTVNDIESRRIGVQSGGIGFNCHRDGYEFRELKSVLDQQ